jgi:hypothetical protein
MTAVDAGVVPAVIRGEIVTEGLVEWPLRSDGSVFRSPDPALLRDRLPLRSPQLMADLYELTLDDICDYLEALGGALDLDVNPYLREACEASFLAAPTTPPIVEFEYRTIASMFRRPIVMAIAESIGRDYLEGWVGQAMPEGHTSYVRAFGARCVHIVAGNSPLLTAWTIVRNAVIRGDALIKLPSNDPFTGPAIARTMVEMAPDHPLTRHLSVAYWKGGSESIESALYQPCNVEKIVAWGGFASLKHVTRYLQPGIELIALDPKRSASLIGREAFATEASLDDAAQRLAFDIGALNQEGCVNARVAYVCCGTDADAIAALEDFGRRVFEHLKSLPDCWSTPPKHGINRDLMAELKALRLDDEWFTVIGGDANEGAVIVSKIPEPVNFVKLLSDRVANIVPVTSVDEMLARVDASTQTVGVYPDSLLDPLGDRLALSGAQRVVSLGYATALSMATPAQDAIEPLRRMCKWVVRDHCDPSVVTPGWRMGTGVPV